jgi:hypothetical protein
LECPNNASTLKNKHDEFGADSNDYKDIPLNVARFAQANASRNRCICSERTERNNTAKFTALLTIFYCIQPQCSKDLLANCY